MGKERRRAARHEANLFAEVETLAGESIGRAVVTDVSFSGIALETEGELPADEQVICHVEIPLTLRATVVRGIKGGAMKRYGLRFEGQSFLDKLLMKKLLSGPRRTRKVNT